MSDEQYQRLVEALRAATEAARKAQDELDRAIEHYALVGGRPPTHAHRDAIRQLRIAADVALMRVLRHRAEAAGKEDGT